MNWKGLRNISVFDSVEKKMKKTYWDKMTDCEDGGWCTSRAFVCSLHGANVSIPPHAYHLYLIYVKQAPPWLLVHRWVTPKRFNSFSWVRSILSCSRWYASDSAEGGTVTVSAHQGSKLAARSGASSAMRLSGHLCPPYLFSILNIF